jgi:hypothetical protein
LNWRKRLAQLSLTLSDLRRCASCGGPIVERESAALARCGGTVGLRLKGSPEVPLVSGRVRCTRHTGCRLIARMAETLPTKIDGRATATRSRAGRVTGKLKRACDLMVWGKPGDKNGKPLGWKSAAEEVGFRTCSMRKALERPHVRAYLAAQKVVWRDQASADTFHRVLELRNQDDNRMAALHAARYLEGDLAQGGNGGGPLVNINITPGVVVDLNPPERPAHLLSDDAIIELSPLDDEAPADGVRRYGELEEAR